MRSTKELPREAKERRDVLLTNPKIRTWFEERKLRSRLSATHDLQNVGLLLHRMGLDPEGAVVLAAKNPDGLREKLVTYASSLKRSGRTDAYIAKSFTGFRNYLAYRHVEFNGFPKLSPTQGTTLEAERIPTPEELGRVLVRLSLRHRVVALFIAHAGVRPHVLGT